MSSPHALHIPARPLTLFALTVGLATFVASYAISIEEGWIYYPWYFLSSSINFSPASNVGAQGLSLALACLPFLAFVRYVQCAERIPENFTLAARLNKISLWSALISAVAGQGVASWQASANVQIHLVFAGVFFSFSLFIALIQVYLDYRCKITGWGKNLRQFNALAALASLGALGLTGLIILIKYEVQNFPRSMVFPMAVEELIFVGAVLGVYATFITDFKGMDITLTVRKRGEDEDEVGIREASQSMNSV